MNSKTNKFRTGNQINVAGVGPWAVIDKEGIVLADFDNRQDAREFLRDDRLRYGNDGQRLAKVKAVQVEVSK